MNLALKRKKFLASLVSLETFDPEGVHHEFNQGLHGKKIDFDKISTGTPLFHEWVELVAESLQQTYPVLPDALVGVANGTNRIVGPLSRKLGKKPLVLETIKSKRSGPILTEKARKIIKLAQPAFIVIIEDVGSRGTNSLSVFRSIKETGQARIEVLNTLQRSQELDLLEVNNVSYSSVLTYVLPTYTAAECKKLGYCRDKWKLISYGARQ